MARLNVPKIISASIPAIMFASLLAACNDGDDEVTGPFTGEIRRYVVDGFTLPMSNVMARSLGDDLDGDSTVDNQLGMVVNTLNSLGNLNTHGADILAAGALTSIVEMQADDPLNDDRVGVWYHGAESDEAQVLGGSLSDGVFASTRARVARSPGRAMVRLPIFVDIDPTAIEMVGMELDLTPDGHGGFDGLVRGSVRAGEVKSTAFSGILAMFAAQPKDHRAFWWLVDTNHDGTVTQPELYDPRGLLNALLAPDLKHDLDGHPQEVISFGFGIHLAPEGTPRGSIVDRCFDRILDGAETGVDCGGDCIPCAGGTTCEIPGDCQSQSCGGGICSPPTCTDGQLDGFESDVDCGGPCPACVPVELCDYDTDCASGHCVGGSCS